MTLRIAIGAFAARCFLVLVSISVPVRLFAQTRCQAGQQVQGAVCILEPLSGGDDEIPIGSSFDTLPIVEYFREALYWIQVTAVGFCVLWIVISGLQMMISSGTGQNFENAKSHLTWSIIGLVMLFFMGFILTTLNSLFYT